MQLHPDILKKDKLLEVVETFIEKHNISCPETIYQMDSVIRDAYEFIEELCNVVGYYELEDDIREE